MVAETAATVATAETNVKGRRILNLPLLEVTDLRDATIDDLDPRMGRPLVTVRWQSGKKERRGAVASRQA
jgi:hypothetical protein